jgi:hypothetical protein
MRTLRERIPGDRGDGHRPLTGGIGVRHGSRISETSSIQVPRCETRRPSDVIPGHLAGPGSVDASVRQEASVGREARFLGVERFRPRKKRGVDANGRHTGVPPVKLPFPG